jgi:hypothetical protein
MVCGAKEGAAAVGHEQCFVTAADNDAPMDHRGFIKNARVDNDRIADIGGFGDHTADDDVSLVVPVVGQAK